MSPRAIAINDVELVVLMLVVALGVALVANRLRFPYTLALVIVGLILGVFHIPPGFNLNPDLVLFLFLPALLFEGAWSLNTSWLKADWLPVLILAVPGVLLSLAVVAIVVHFGVGLPLVTALVLGAIISPTDPVAVVSLLRQLGMPERLRTIIEGESLFNDGVGAAAYEVMLGLLLLSLHLSSELSGMSTALIALKTVWLFAGGPLIGVGLGLLISRLVKVLDDHLIETAVTFSAAYGSYILGIVLGTSGLLAVVGAGLTLGSYGRRVGMTRRTRYAVDDIWEFTGYLANSFLFLLLGHQIGAVTSIPELPAIGWAVLGVVVGRVLMVYLMLPIHDALAYRLVLRARHMHALPFGLPLPKRLPNNWRPLLVFSGLRGALSLALALTLPTQLPSRRLVEVTVYGVVLVTLLGQGIWLRFLLPRWPKGEP